MPPIDFTEHSSLVVRALRTIFLIFFYKVRYMNWDIFAGNWKQFRGKLKVRWGRFNNDHFGVIDGRRTQSAGIAQESYGIARDKLRHKQRRSA